MIVDAHLRHTCLALTLDGLRSLSKPLDLESLCCLEEGWQLVLRHIYLASVHELQDGLQVTEWHVFQDDDWVLRRVLLKYYNVTL
jgi:hypothetical protein